MYLNLIMIKIILSLLHSIKKMKFPNLIFDVDYTLYGSKDIPEQENNTEDITNLFYSMFKPNKKLYEMLQSHLDNIYLFSNGNLPHVTEVIEKIGLKSLFPEKRVATLDDYEDYPKPYVGAYSFVIKKFNLQPNDECYFFEDNLENLKIAKQKYNWNTIFIDEEKTTNKKLSHYPYVDYTFKDINKALTYLLQKIKKKQTKEELKLKKEEKKIISPKLSPRRKRTHRNKIDDTFVDTNKKKKKEKKKRNNKRTVRSPFRHRSTYKNKQNKQNTNLINKNRLERLERL